MKKNILPFLVIFLVLISCEKEAPETENEVEIMTDISLVFTNTNVPQDVVIARAQDKDGPGIEPMRILDSIQLSPNSTYILSFEIWNNLNPEKPENVWLEIKDEDDEHQVFFQFTENAFKNPGGKGNFDDAQAPLNYLDFDSNGNPLGLETEWTTGDTVVNAFFRVRLAHQPDVKTSTSTVNDGDIDFDLEFVLSVK